MLFATIGGLAGCGQKGPLFLPTGADAVGRASLPQSILPRAVLPGSVREPTATSASPAASPAGSAADLPGPGR